MVLLNECRQYSNQEVAAHCVSGQVQWRHERDNVHVIARQNTLTLILPYCSRLQACTRYLSLQWRSATWPSLRLGSYDLSERSLPWIVVAMGEEQEQPWVGLGFFPRLCRQLVTTPCASHCISLLTSASVFSSIRDNLIDSTYSSYFL